MKIVSISSVLLVALAIASVSAVAADLPACNSKQVVGMVIDSENAYFRHYPIAYGDLRTTDAEQPVELGADGTARYCVANARRTDKIPGEVGYVVEWVDRGRGQFIVNTKNADKLRAQFEKPAAPIPAPVAIAAPPKIAPAPPPSPAPVGKVLSAVYDKCINEANGSMPDMTECADIESAAQDRRLNVAYKVAMASTSNKDALKTAQRAWIKFRDKRCASKGTGGQNDDLESADCTAQVTAKRAAELEAMK